MANELDGAIDAVATLLATLSVVGLAEKEEPDTVAAAGPGKCVAAVLLGDGDLGQNATQQSRELHTLILRFYIPRDRNKTQTEQIARQLISSVQTLFQTNITLNGATGVIQALVVGRYTAQYQKVAGIQCRVLDMPLQVDIRVTRTWSES